jgi:hypothetical protein
MLARVVVSVVAIVCLTGWLGTMSSYGRYREIAAFAPPLARDWPFWGTAFSGPYALGTAAAFFGRRNREFLAVSLGACLILSGLGLWESCTPISRDLRDRAEEAGMRLFVAGSLQYLVSGPLALAAIVVNRGNIRGDIYA